MTDPSWGRGWPQDNSAKMKTVRANISGTTLLVHREIAPLVQWIINEIERRGHLLDYGPKDVNDDWGYSNRPIAGTRIPSNHSWGLAIDLDATQYPQGQRKRVPPQWITDIFKLYKFENGAVWNHPDPMHYEFMGSVNDARWLVAALAAHSVQNTPPPVPPSAPTPNPLPARQSITPGYRGHLVDIFWWELAIISRTSSGSAIQRPAAEGDVYWGGMIETIKNLGKILQKDWDGHFMGPDQWAAVDFLYKRAGFEPVV